MFQSTNLPQSLRMVEREELLGSFCDCGEVQLPESIRDIFDKGWAQSGADEDRAQRVYVAAVRQAAQQGGFEKSCASPQKGIVNDVSGPGQPFDEEARQ